MAIADNVTYVATVVQAVSREWPGTPILVYTGFSQGVATAFRAAIRSSRSASGVIALGGDVPPELGQTELGSIPAALIGRGRADTLYDHDVFETDVRRLREAGVVVRALEVDSQHEWSAEFSAAAAHFLAEQTPR